MRRLLTVVVLAAAAIVVTGPALAGNQEVADEIAKNLRDSGKLSKYRIEVKYQQGTARLTGYVRDQAQMATALKLALETTGVERVVNDLVVGSPRTADPNTASQPQSPRELHVSTFPAEPGQGQMRQVSAAEWPSNEGGDEMDLQEAPPSRQPTRGARPALAQRVPTSFVQAPARQVAATQPVTRQQATSRRIATRSVGRPIPIAYTQPAAEMEGAPMPGAPMPGGPIPAYVAGTGGGVAPAQYDQPNLPNYAWPSYAAYPNYAGLTYPRQYSPTAWPYIGPFYPYPQVPLGWRKVTLQWDDGWWMLDFKDRPSCWPSR
jgi:hypothetical protein